MSAPLGRRYFGRFAWTGRSAVSDDLRDRSDLEDHIQTLEEFEILCGEFLVDRRNGNVTGPARSGRDASAS